MHAPAARSVLPARQRSAAHFKNDEGRTDEIRLDHFATSIAFSTPGSLELPPFSYLQCHLDGQDFQTRDDIKKPLEQFFKDHSPAFWSKGIYDLPNRWQKTMDANGAHFK